MLIENAESSIQQADPIDHQEPAQQSYLRWNFIKLGWHLKRTSSSQRMRGIACGFEHDQRGEIQRRSSVVAYVVL